MLFLGLSAGIPILLIFSSLSLWLREAGVSRAAVTFFSWAALGYSFKFVWAPIIDRMPLPWLDRLLGRRRSWLLLAQLAVTAAICWMAVTDPALGESHLRTMAMAAVLLGFSSATQDIVIDAYRIESAGEALQALMSSAYITGYRIGMLIAGAGALYLAQYFGSTTETYAFDAWRLTYLCVAATMSIGIVTTLVIREPDVRVDRDRPTDPSDYVRFFLLFVAAVTGFIAVFLLTRDMAVPAHTALIRWTGNGALASFVIESLRLVLALAVAACIGFGLVRAGLTNYRMLESTYIEPIGDFFSRYGFSAAVLLLALIGCYRISDIVLGVISNVFYQDIGFDKEQIATVVKTFGLIMTIVGSFAGGLVAMKIGVLRTLLIGAALAALTNLLFVLLANMGNHLPMLYVVIAADNLSAGFATAAFVAFLSSLTSISFTAVQYAVFSSLMTLVPKLLGGYSGTIVDAMGYANFFLFTAVLGVPALLLVIVAGRRLEISAGVDGAAVNNA